MSFLFKILLFVALSFLTSFNLIASKIFFSIAKEAISTHSIYSWKYVSDLKTTDPRKQKGAQFISRSLKDQDGVSAFEFEYLDNTAVFVLNNKSIDCKSWSVTSSINNIGGWNLPKQLVGFVMIILPFQEQISWVSFQWSQVVDRNTKEILWTTKCEPGVYFEDAPQIKEHKLYLLASSKTLHIFEKETTPTAV